MITAILARTPSNGIGMGMGLPWPHNSKDMKWFSENTRNKIVVMGRKTWETLGSVPLPKRTNYVVTNSDLGEYNNLVVSGEMGDLLRHIESYHTEDVVVIGGSDVYKQAFPFVDRILLTTFKHDYESDTFVDLDVLDDMRSEIVYEDEQMIIEVYER